MLNNALKRYLFDYLVLLFIFLLALNGIKIKNGVLKKFTMHILHGCFD